MAGTRVASQRWPLPRCCSAPVAVRQARRRHPSTAANPLKGLVTTTAPGSKHVSSVTWAVYRDVNSLDPIFAFDYPENTAVSLLCESLLRQAPDGAVGPGLATLATPSPTKFVLTLKPGVHVLGRSAGHAGRRRLQPRPGTEQQAGRLLRPGVHPGEVDQRDRFEPGDDHSQGARLLAGGRIGLDAGHRHREEVRRGSRARTTARRVAASCAPAPTSSSRARPASA